MERPFERVYTVNDYYDGPRQGFADFDGQPHAYNSIWRDDLDCWDPQERFELSPVSSDVMQIVLEDWEIFRRWEEAFCAGRAPESTHPALPEDRARHDEIDPLVERALQIDPVRRRIASGEFRNLAGPGGPRIPTSRAILQVRWTPADPVDDR